jgi:hypothetical protein
VLRITKVAPHPDAFGVDPSRHSLALAWGGIKVSSLAEMLLTTTS